MSAKKCSKSIEVEMFLPSAQEVEFEKALYAAMDIPSSTQPEPIAIKSVGRRKVKKWSEPFSRCPQNIFTFTIGKQAYVGRKLISKLKLSGKLKELHCSRITAAMILGLSKGFEHSCNKVDIFYFPLTPGEKIFLFTQLKADSLIDVYHPFVFLDKNSKERCSPPSGWSLDTARAQNLALGEQHIRSITLAWLKEDSLAGKIVYDPACSTGLFLNTIKQAFKNCVTIGQDLSKDMVAYARQRLDQAILGDALYPGVPDSYCDYIFIRFLNSEVVTRAQAYHIFPALLKKLKDNGKLIIFGHTPVLLNIPYIESCYGLHALKRIALDEQEDAILQYYILQKLAF